MVTHHTTTTDPTPSRLPTPPPIALDLSHAGRAVGWVRGDTIGFRGFASNVEAAHAAWVGYRALAQRLAKAGGRRPIPVDIARVTLRRRGDVDVVMASGQPIATLLQPGPASRSGDSFGFEIRVPAPTYETRLRGMAYLVYRTLRKSGVRWALWARDRDRRESRGDVIPAERTTEHGGRTAADQVSSTRGAPATEPMKRGRTRRWATVLTISATASVIGLLLAFVVPDRLAGPVGVLGLTGLLASRLLASWTGVRDPSNPPGPTARPARETRTERDRAPQPAVASEAAD